MCRSQLAFGSPESAHSLTPSLATDTHTNGTPSHPVATPSSSPQRTPLHQSTLQPPPSPFTQSPSGRTAAHNPPSSPMSIPSSRGFQPSGEQAPESSSATPDLHSHINQWAARNSNSQEEAPAARHQLPQASPSGHFEEGSAGKERHHAARRSVLHSRSSRGKTDSGSAHGQGIRWNDSRDSLWSLSSNEDLAQLVPDRASKGGVEQAPEVASFTGQRLLQAVPPLCACHNATQPAAAVLL